MRILTYKRTHIGDPDAEGVFGVGDCMGRVRGWDYDAVIGVGGYGDEPRQEGIDGRITWLGQGPTRSPDSGGRAELVLFERFRLLDANGPLLHEVAPLLARRMYEKGARVLLRSYSKAEKVEAEQLLAEWLSDAPPSIAPSRRIAASGPACGKPLARRPCRPRNRC